MAVVLVRAEGFNHNATIFDTNDLSTIRGASLALLDIGGRWVPDRATEGTATGTSLDRELLKEAIERATGKVVLTVQTGASMGTLVCEVPDDTDADAFGAKVHRALADIQAEGRKQLPQKTSIPDRSDDDSRKALESAQGHLTIAVDAVDLDAVPATAGDTPAAKIDDAQARNRARQFREFTVAPVAFVTSKRAVDPFDDVGVAEFQGPRRDRGNTEVRLRLSRATRHRRDVGRDEKFNLFVRRLGQGHQDLFGDDTLTFANDFQAIIADDEALGLKHNVRRKLAVVHADGNSFGKVREAVGVPTFSYEIERLRRTLLADIATWLKHGVETDEEAFVAEVDDLDADSYGVKRVVRFETILWGGDEMAFVLPAWNALAFAERLVDWTRDWAIGGHPLSFAIGVTIANVKTPIRHMREIADKAASLAKEATRAKDQKKQGKKDDLKEKHSVSVEVFESLPPPDAGLKVFRADLYRLPRGWRDADQNALAKGLACPGDQFAELIKMMRDLKRGCDASDNPEEEKRRKHGPFPRSQLYAALRKALEGERSCLDADATSKERHSLINPKADEAAFLHLDRYLRNAGTARGLSLDLLRLPSLASQERAADAKQGDASASKAISDERALQHATAGLALDCARIVALWDYVDPLDEVAGGET